MSGDTFKPKIGDGSTILPQARVKTIMKSSPDTENISVEALYYITKATVLTTKLH
jgi:chromatin accessibility complex protein 1